MLQAIKLDVHSSTEFTSGIIILGEHTGGMQYAGDEHIGGTPGRSGLLLQF